MGTTSTRVAEAGEWGGRVKGGETESARNRESKREGATEGDREREGGEGREVRGRKRV